MAFYTRDASNLAEYTIFGTQQQPKLIANTPNTGYSCRAFVKAFYYYPVRVQ